MVLYCNAIVLRINLSFKAILYLFPDKYSKEDLERAYLKYNIYVDFRGVDIAEVKFYDINS